MGDTVTSGNRDLQALPVLRRFLRWRHGRTSLQLPMLILAGLMVFDGLTGPQLAPKNLATTLTWVHYRGLLVLALLLAGNLFCLACPFMLVRNLLRRFVHPRRSWPAWLRHKALAIGLFLAMLFAYELFDLWSTPFWTAVVILGYLAAALIIDGLFRGAPFCKYLCPLGQFSFVAALLSPLEVAARDPAVCTACRTKDCIRGSPPPGLPPQSRPTVPPEKPGEGLNRLLRPLRRPAGRTEGLPGCQLWLYQPAKVGNMDCTFCLDCARACPFGNVGLSARIPGSELWIDPLRSGIGRFSRRPDLAVLVALFTFGALLNAFAMVTPVYALEEWLAGVLHSRSEALILGLIFVAGLGLLPAALLAATAAISRRLSGPAARRSVAGTAVRYAYALVPLGLGIWLAHYAFHLLTGFWTFVPVAQNLVDELAGSPLLGVPRWGLGPLVPAGWLYPLELGFLGLGWFGSLLVAYRLAAAEEAESPWPAWLPWAVLQSILLGIAIWLMAQPMEMRGTLLAG